MPWRRDPATGKFIEVDPAGNPVQSPSQPTMQGTVGPFNLPPMSQEGAEQTMDVLKEGALGGLNIGSLLLGIPPIARTMHPAMRLALQGGIGGAQGALGQGGLISRGPIGGAIEGALTEGVGMAGRPTADLGTRLAYRVGGMTKAGASEAADALNTVNRARSGPLRRRILVGQEPLLEDFRQKVGKDIASEVKKVPGLHDVKSVFAQAEDPLRRKAAFSADPTKEQSAIKVAKRRLVRGHAGTPNITGIRGQNVGITPGGGTGRFIDNPTLHELETNLKNTTAAQNITKARRGGEMITAPMARQGQFDLRMGEAAKRARYMAEAGLPPNALGPLPPGLKQPALDELYSNVKTAQSANKMLKAPDIFAEPGKMGARGGLISALARSAGVVGGAGLGYAGAGPVGGVVGSLLGPAVLSPIGMSFSSNLAGNLMEAFPHLARTTTGAKQLDRILEYLAQQEQEEP